MPDGNSAALSAHEAKEEARQKSFDSLLPEAEEYLREWVRDGDTIGKPRQFEKLSPFLLADLITDDHWQHGIDSELVCNLILGNDMSEELKRIGDHAFEVWRLTDQAEDAVNNICDWLEQCEVDNA